MRLEDAAVAYEAALKEFTASRAPFQWAMTRYNLGQLLTMLADRTRDVGIYEKAKRSFVDAHEVFESAGHPAADATLAKIKLLDELISSVTQNKSN